MTGTLGRSGSPLPRRSQIPGKQPWGANCGRWESLAIVRSNDPDFAAKLRVVDNVALPMLLGKTRELGAVYRDAHPLLEQFGLGIACGVIRRNCLPASSGAW